MERKRGDAASASHHFETKIFNAALRVDCSLPHYFLALSLDACCSG